MPLRFEIDTELGIVLTTAEGAVTEEDLADHARALAKTPGRPTRELVDLTSSPPADVPAGAVRETASFLRSEDVNVPGSRLALAAGDDSLFGLMRLYAAHRQHEGVEIEVFRDREDALCWLCRE